MQSTEPPYTEEETAAFPFPTTASWSSLSPGNATECVQVCVV